MRRSPIALLGAAAWLIVPPAAAATSLCPETVTAKQVGVAPAPEWSVSYSALPNDLKQVTFYSGPPQEEASLVYDDLASAKGSSRATWRFAKDPRGYWVKCSYRGTTLELSKALPPAVSSCQVTYDRGTVSAAGVPAIKSIACQ